VLFKMQLVCPACFYFFKFLCEQNDDDDDDICQHLYIITVILFALQSKLFGAYVRAIHRPNRKLLASAVHGSSSVRDRDF